MALAVFALLAGPAAAQPTSKGPTPDPPAPPAPDAPPLPGASDAPVGRGAAAPDPREDVLKQALAARQGGLTPAAVSRRAIKATPSVKRRLAELEAASARVDQALVSYFPTLSVAAGYTRMSKVDNVLVLSACPGNPGLLCQLRPEEVIGTAVQTTFIFQFLNRWSVVGSVLVPLSDYALRISQQHAAAKAAERSSELLHRAEQLEVGSAAQLLLFAWVAAEGQRIVAEMAVEQSRAHLKDAESLIDLGLASRSDVLRLEALLAASEQLEAEAKAFLLVAEEQLRMTVDAPRSEKLAIGFDMFDAPTAIPESKLDDLIARAHKRRLELKALQEQRESLEQAEKATFAGYLPRVDGFGNVYFANPNPRQIPMRAEWYTTWDVGVQLTWTINDTFRTIGKDAQAQAEVRAVVEQRADLERAVRMEVARAYADVNKAVASIASAERGLTSAEESLRARLELFRAGEANSVDIVDAETELTRARLARIKAHIDYLSAKTRLAHAVGDDVPMALR